MENKNKFGRLLQQYIKEAGLKNAVISKALQYDLSYISKWISGKMMPSSKNAENVISGISSCIVQQSSEDKLSDMLKKHGCKSSEELKGLVYDELMQEYMNYAEKKKEDTGHRFYPEMETDAAAAKVKEALSRPDGTAAASIDLLSLNHESRLLIAGIEGGVFDMGVQENLEFNMGICVDTALEDPARDCVYDSIFLVHMITCLSGINFRLYNDKMARNRFLFAMKDRYLLSGNLFAQSERMISVVEDTDDKATDILYRQISQTLDQENLIFRETSMSSMLKSMDYERSLISQNQQWLIGHMLELVIPESLLTELLSQHDFEDAERIRRVHQIASGFIAESPMKIMIYESALTELVITGELDFFNHRIELTGEQKMQCLSYIQELNERENTQIRLVDGGFSSDFQYITNPCMFLSEKGCYLRLENNRYENNIRILNDASVKEMFERFYENVWSNRPDVVISSESDIASRLEYYMDTVKIVG